MSTKWFTASDVSIEALLKMVDEKRIALPEFQRPFKWDDDDIAALLRSVCRNWPAGTFLLLHCDGKPPFKTQGIDSAPEPEDADIEDLLLDGQQRTTALYHAIRGDRPTTFFVDLGNVEAAGSFDDEHLDYMKTADYRKQYPSLAAEAEAMIARVEVVADLTKFNQWMNHFDDDRQTELLALVKQHLEGLFQSSYEFPTNTLKTETELAAIAKIFETINLRGEVLDAFDLMVARLWPEFNLRDQWEAALQQRPILSELKIPSMMPLELIALWTHFEQREEVENKKRQALSVKGIRRADILELSPADVVPKWDEAIEAIDAAVTMLQSTCGIRRANLVPQYTMLLPIADAYRGGDVTRGGFDRDLRRWFWFTCFSQTFRAGSNTKAIEQSELLRLWAMSEKGEPADLQAFDANSINLLDSKSRNTHLLRGLMARLISRGVVDWKTADKLADDDRPIDFHHTLPQDMLEPQYYKQQGADGSLPDRDPIANFSPVLAKTNRSLRDMRPESVLNAGVGINDIAGHLISGDLYKSASEEADSILEYLLERQKRLRAEMTAAVKG